MKLSRLLPLLLALAVVSCTAEKEEFFEDDENIHVSGGYKLKKRTFWDDYDTNMDSYTTFAYDKNGRVKEIVYVHESKDIYKDVISWGDNMVYYEWMRYEEDQMYTFEKDKVIRKETKDYTMRFEYDPSNRLYKYYLSTKSHDSEVTYYWDNGKLSKVTRHDDAGTHQHDYTYRISYEGDECNGYFPWFFPSDDYIFCPLIQANPELVGIKQTYIPSKVELKGYSSYSGLLYDRSYYIECQKDKNGCVDFMLIKEKETHDYGNTYTFEWGK